jgi:hypothetical protein
MGAARGDGIQLDVIAMESRRTAAEQQAVSSVCAQQCAENIP